jgi:hypothetical protein
MYSFVPSLRSLVSKHLQLIVSKNTKKRLWLAGDADIVTISASTGKVRGLFTVCYI